MPSLAKASFLARMALLGSLLAGGHAHAGLSVPTRVVFDGSGQEQTLVLGNAGKQPSLVQAWLDTGDPDVDPASLNVPFLLTSPLFRVEPDASHSLRILHLDAGASLPQDRETRLFLNLVDVPPRDASGEHQRLSLAVHYRMPFLYRPAALRQPADSHPTVRAAAHAQWSLHDSAEGMTLTIANTSGYSLTFRGIDLGPTGTEYQVPSGEVAPFAKASFAMPSGANAPASGSWHVRYSVADDAGYAVPGEAPLALPHTPPSTL